MPVAESQKLLNDLEDLLVGNPELERRLPVRPEEPLPQDCCGQSCEPCVFDIYRTELDSWARRSWRRIKNPDAKDEDEEELEALAKIKEHSALFTLQPNSYQSLKLVSITPMTIDTNIYRFALPRTDQKLFLPVGTHIIMKGCYEATKNEKRADQNELSLPSDPPASTDRAQRLLSVVRQYTPITSPDTAGFVDLMIKMYAHGKMSSHLRRLQSDLENERGEGVRSEFRGPYGLFSYDQNRYTDLLMLAAGTGVAPMAQVIEHILRNDDTDMTRIRLLFCCRRYEEILLKERLDDWRRKWNFSVCYILSQWREETDRRLVKYGEEVVTGCRLDQQRVTDEIRRLQQLETARNENTKPESAAPSPSSSSPSSPPPPGGFQVLVCGTKAFEKDMMNYLLKAGVVAKRIFRF